MTSSITIKRLGIVEYETAWALMKNFVSNDSLEQQDEIWICSHPKVFTLGVAGNPSHVLNPGGIPVVRTDRGGQVTYHGPGQIVVYPLIHLLRRGLLPKKYLWKLEEGVIETLGEFGIESFRIKGAPGIYVKGSGTSGPFNGAEKICSIGIHISRNIAYHGLSLNFNTDLDDFRKINPCGYRGLKVTNMSSLVPNVTEETVIDVLSKKLMEQLHG